MPVKNKYANRSKISEAKTRELVRLFCYDLDATQMSKVAKIIEIPSTGMFMPSGCESPSFVKRNPPSLGRSKLMKAFLARVDRKVVLAVEPMGKQSFSES